MSHVHKRTIDHLPDGTSYQRFNKKLATLLTSKVGTMTCFWVFLAMCLTVLPSVLSQMHISLGPSFMQGFGFELLATWLLSTCFQLILLPGLMVGQNLQNAAADARSAKTFEDTEVILDRLDTRTEGGLKEIADRLDRLEGDHA